MKVAIFGAGTMGSGIAQVFAAKGHTALMYASSVPSAQKHKDKLAASLAKRVAKGKMTQEAVDALLANILVEEKSAAADADLVIECVKEDMATKRTLLKELDELCKPETVFASNTSSLSVTEMGLGLKHPVIGMHFFNPVPSMKLVEVIRGANTTQDTFDFIYSLSKEIGKDPVEVAEAPGFVVNKILIPMINEAIGLVETGVASVEDIDGRPQVPPRSAAEEDGPRRPAGPQVRQGLLRLQQVRSNTCSPPQLTAAGGFLIYFRISQRVKHLRRSGRMTQARMVAASAREMSLSGLNLPPSEPVSAPAR